MMQQLPLFHTRQCQQSHQIVVLHAVQKCSHSPVPNKKSRSLVRFFFRLLLNTAKDDSSSSM